MKAKAGGNPALLDFFADCCVSCKLVAFDVFPSPSVASRLDDVYLMNADVTDSARLLEHCTLGHCAFRPCIFEHCNVVGVIRQGEQERSPCYRVTHKI